MDWFCGAGGSSQGAHAVPGVDVALAANHWQKAIESHARNFPTTTHYKGDIREAPVERWPVADIFWASPECPKWSGARGVRRTFDRTTQLALDLGDSTEEDRATREEEERSRALMEEVPLYLRGVQQRGGRLLAGVVENVIDVRGWDQWDRWVGEIRNLGYQTRLIALNSMHAKGRLLDRAPQSRDRLYLAYWHTCLGRTPDWDKWLRPTAWCETCQTSVRALQMFKTPGRDMGRYRQQYVYRCPHTTCRNQTVEPTVLPAATAIDWSLPGQRIGDRAKPLAEKTIRRIEAGLKKFAQPLVAPAGGTWRNDAAPITDPLPTRTTRENDGLAIPRLPASAAMVMRNNGSRGDGGEHCTPASDPLRTLTTAGHQSLLTWERLLVPYYGNGTARSVHEPVGTLSTRDRYALVKGDNAIEDVLFRMLEPHEIGRAMSFADQYTVLGNKRERVRQYGNAVTPNVAELLVAALVEAITGEELSRHEAMAA